MKKKKLLALLLVLVMMVGLVGCSKGGDSSETKVTDKQNVATQNESTEPEKVDSEEKKPVKLVVAWWGSQTRNERFQSALDLYCELNPHVTIETQTAGFNDHLTSMSVAAASDQLPDLIMLQADYYDPYIQGNLLTDLTPYISSGALDLSNVATNVIDTGRVGEGIFGICTGVNSPSVLYNKTLLDENGITLEDNMSLDQFAEKSKEVYEKTGYKTFVGNPYQMVEFLLRGKGKVLYESGKLGADSWEELLPYFSLIERGRNEGWLIDYGVTVGLESTEEQPIVYGTTPETSSWCSFYNSNQSDGMQTAAPEGMVIALTTCPSDNITSSNYLRQAMSWCVPSQGDNADEAVELLNWWTNSIDANKLIMGEPGVPISSKVVEEISPSLTDIQQRIFSYINNVVTPNSSVGNPPAAAGNAEVSNFIKELNEKVYYGQSTAEVAAKELFEQGNKIMDSYK
jgi:multiple sugar transport system substrate-binding protein